jgi:ubiquitin-conjugating enzyme E2 Z
MATAAAEDETSIQDLLNELSKLTVVQSNSQPLPKTHHDPGAIKRICHDFKCKDSLTKDGIFFCEEKPNDITKLIVIIIGRPETPYFGCQFLFTYSFPTDYPYTSPTVEFCSSDGNVRLAPNLYVYIDGKRAKVCLSILGTYAGEAWTSTMTTEKVLLSILSMTMTEKSLRNEPGLERSSETDIINYDRCVKYSSLKLTAEQIMGCSELFMPLFYIMEQQFLEYFDSNMSLIDDSILKETDSPFSVSYQRTSQSNLKTKYIELKQKYMDVRKSIELFRELSENISKIKECNIKSITPEVKEKFLSIEVVLSENNKYTRTSNRKYLKLLDEYGKIKDILIKL